VTIEDDVEEAARLRRSGSQNASAPVASLTHHDLRGARRPELPSVVYQAVKGYRISSMYIRELLVEREGEVHYATHRKDPAWWAQQGRIVWHGGEKPKIEPVRRGYYLKSQTQRTFEDAFHQIREFAREMATMYANGRDDAEKRAADFMTERDRFEEQRVRAEAFASVSTPPWQKPT
jgi:hypothetical protein